MNTSCVECKNPIVNFIEYVSAQIIAQEITTYPAATAYVEELLTAGYFVSNKYSNLCCPDCPDENCEDGVYFLGDADLFVQDFTVLMDINVDTAERPVNPNHLCCTNYYMSVDKYHEYFDTTRCSGVYSCCNKFNSECLDSFLAYFYDTTSATYTLGHGYWWAALTSGIVEYSTINGNSALCDIIEALKATSLICQVAFITGMFSLGIVVSCGCRPGYTGVMSYTRFASCISPT